MNPTAISKGTKRKPTIQTSSEKRKQSKTKAVLAQTKPYKTNWQELTIELKRMKEIIVNVPHLEINISSNIYVNSDYAAELDKSFSYYTYFSSFNDESVLNTLQYLFYKVSCGIMLGKYNNNDFHIIPFLNENYENNWIDLITIPHKYFASKTKYLLSKNIEFDLDDKEKMICNMNHIYSTENSKNEIISKLEYDSLVLYNLITNLLMERQIPYVNVFFNIFRNGALKELLNEPSDQNNNIILRRYLFMSYCPIISFCKKSDCSDLIGISTFDWMLATRIIFDKNNDEKYISSIQTASEWIMKENCILYRGNICGIFDEKNDLSYNVYKKLISLSPQNHLKFDFKLLKPSVDDYIDNNNTITFIKYDDVEYDKQWNNINVNKYKYIIVTPDSYEYIGYYIKLHCVLLIVKVENNYNTIYDIILKPNIHYIPIDKDLSNIQEIINDISINTAKYSQMSDDAYNIIDHYLSRNGILDFYQYLFTEINKHYHLRSKEEYDCDYFSIDDDDYSYTSVPNNRKSPVFPKYKNASCPCPRCKTLL